MRLPPIPPDQLAGDQRDFHDEAVALIAGKFPSNFKTRREDGALLGPWTAWVREPAIGRASQALIASIARLGALSPRVHEIVILTVGAHFEAAYELYAHCALARDATLTDRQIATLCAGRRPEDLSEPETIAFDCAAILARGGVLPGFLYAAAKKEFGSKGFSHLTYLAAFYAFVSVTLNAYDIPAPEIVATR